jgi:hypothetical protein
MRFGKWGWAAVLATAWILFDVKSANAWAPATHIRLANDLLSQGWLLPAGMAAFLWRYFRHYVYGNIAADIVFAKRMSHQKQICHQWSTGFRLLEHADRDRDKAFALGYLSHLAADTVAHGQYLPHQFLTTRTTLNFGHLYWELRADQLAGEDALSQLRIINRAKFARHHESLDKVIAGTFLSPGANVAVFRRLNRISAAPSFRQSLDTLNANSRWDLCSDLLSRFRDQSVERMASVMARGSLSPVVRDDPNGTAAFAFVKEQRRHLRRMRITGKQTSVRRAELAVPYAPPTSRRLGPAVLSSALSTAAESTARQAQSMD